MTTPRTTRAALLEVSDLAVAYGDRPVLEGISFTLAAGEAFGLLGPNGAGKSSALQALVGLLVPRGGTLRLDGTPIPFGDRRLRARAGVVFQAGSLDGRLTARENLALHARLFGLASAEAERRGDELLGWSGLADRANEPVARYSGGMRRKLEIARALLSRPSLLLLDEPTAGLDEAAFRAVWERLDALRRDEGIALLLTSHRPEEAERCDRLAVLDAGRIVAEGSPETLRERVAGDVVTLEADDPAALALLVTERLGLPARIAGDVVIVEREKGHELVPRLVEALPAGRLRSVGLHRPTLADAFLKLTGRALARPVADGGERPLRKRKRRAA